MTVFNFDASGFLRRTSSRKVVIQIPLRKVMKNQVSENMVSKIWYPKYETCKYRHKGTSFRKYGIQNMKRASIDVRAPVSENMVSKIFAKMATGSKKTGLGQIFMKMATGSKGT